VIEDTASTGGFSTQYLLRMTGNIERRREGLACRKMAKPETGFAINYVSVFLCIRQAPRQNKMADV